MGWSIGYDNSWGRDIGYGVPAICDFPKCDKKIDRGLAYVCGGEPHCGEHGCGLFFCEKHFKYRIPHGADSYVQLCPRCYSYRPAYKPKPDCLEWINFKLKDISWKEWRKNNKDEVAKMKQIIDFK